MSAWLITWNWMGDSAEVVDKVVAIINPRKSPKAVAEIVEFLSTQNHSTLSEFAFYAKEPSNNPYRAKTDFSQRIRCGHHPWLSAELVSDLIINTDPITGIETIEWTTQNVYAPTEDEDGFKIISGPKRRSFTRTINGPVSHDLKWDS